MLSSDLVRRRPGQQRCLRPRRAQSRPTGSPGMVTLSGGTGRFSGFHATVWVTCNARRQPLCVGRTVQLHPTRPRQISRSATRSHRHNRLGTGPPVPSHVAQRPLECPPRGRPQPAGKVHQANRGAFTRPSRTEHHPPAPQGPAQNRQGSVVSPDWAHRQSRDRGRGTHAALALV